MNKPTDEEFIQTLRDELKRKEMALLAIYSWFGFKASGHDLVVDFNYNKAPKLDDVKKIFIHDGTSEKIIKKRFEVINDLLTGKHEFDESEWEDAILD